MKLNSLHGNVTVAVCLRVIDILKDTTSTPECKKSVFYKAMKLAQLPTELWRADKFPTASGTTASVAYSGAPMKYFATMKDEIVPYANKNPHQKQWKITGSLRLLDILDPATHDLLYEGADVRVQRSMDTAFPKDESGTPFRHSEEDTATDDDRVLMYICQQGYDGYYTAKQVARQGVMGFHSEVGLCGDALKNLTMVGTVKDTAPAIQDRPPPPSRNTDGIQGRKLFGGRKKKHTRRKKKFKTTRRRTKNGVSVSV